MIKNKNGFTLIELIFVMALIAILSAITVPIVRNSVNGYGFTNSLQDIKSSLQKARLTAIQESIPVTVEFTPATNSYQVFKDVSDAGYGDGIVDTGETVIASGVLKKGITLEDTTFRSGNLGFNKTQFNKDGFPVMVLSDGTLDVLAGDIELSYTDSSQELKGIISVVTSGKISTVKQSIE